MLKEFKAFIAQGNVLDLAIGVIIGSAFGKITASLVGDIFMPIIGIFIGGIDFKKLAITVGSANVLYGNFIQTVIEFLIIAFVVFMIIQTATRAGLVEKKQSN